MCNKIIGFSTLVQTPKIFGGRENSEELVTEAKEKSGEAQIRSYGHTRA